MSARSRKAGSVAPQNSGPAVSPITVRPSSPLSPTRHSRLAEKADLQNLNDRLACYIDRVRYLETENARLTLEVRTSQETVTRETSNIKQMYEHELSDARKLLDETAREKAKLEIDVKRLLEQNDDLRQRYVWLTIFFSIISERILSSVIKNNNFFIENRIAFINIKILLAMAMRDDASFVFMLMMSCQQIPFLNFQ